MGEYRYQVRRFGFVLKSLTAMNHQSGSEGNHGVAARTKVRLPDGSFASVPYVSGNAMRNRMRHAAAIATLSAAGLLDGLGPQLSQRAVQLLFSGGLLEGGTGGFAQAKYLELCDLFPHLRLLGGAAGGQINPGMLQVSDLTLICEETAHVLPDLAVKLGGGHVCDLECGDPCQLRPAGMPSAREHIDVQQRVRGDAGRTLTGQQMMLDADREAVAARRLLRDEAALAGDLRTVAETKSLQLPYTYETVCAGTLWSWRVSAATTSALEEDMLATVLYHTLAALQTQGVGGKTSHGLGRLQCVEAEGLPWRPLRTVLREEDVGTELADGHFRPGRLFAAHVAERREAIAHYLRKDQTLAEAAAAATKGKAKKSKATVPDEAPPEMAP